MRVAIAVVHTYGSICLYFCTLFCSLCSLFASLVWSRVIDPRRLFLLQLFPPSRIGVSYALNPQSLFTWKYSHRFLRHTFFCYCRIMYSVDILSRRMSFFFGYCSSYRACNDLRSLSFSLSISSSIFLVYPVFCSTSSLFVTYCSSLKGKQIAKSKLSHSLRLLIIVNQLYWWMKISSAGEMIKVEASVFQSTFIDKVWMFFFQIA